MNVRKLPAIAPGKHTPGPWKARDYRSDGKAGNAQDGSIWIDCVAYTKSGRAIGGTVAEVYARGTGTDDPSVQGANARLIAAAPELLAALEWFVTDLTAERSSMVDFDANLASARAAIQKARNT